MDRRSLFKGALAFVAASKVPVKQPTATERALEGVSEMARAQQVVLYTNLNGRLDPQVIMQAELHARRERQAILARDRIVTQAEIDRQIDMLHQLGDISDEQHQQLLRKRAA